MPESGVASTVSKARGEMIERIEFGGWPNCLRLANEAIELVATTDAGPRIIRLGFLGGQNLFKTFDSTLGLSGGDTWRIYGGHRLWHAPEVYPRTYAPDNGPVVHEWDGKTLSLRMSELDNGVDKELRVTLDPVAPLVEVRHRITNRNSSAVELVPWLISVMAPGGRAIIPQEEHRPHLESLDPACPVVLWRYTDMSDPRWTWGRRYVQLRQDPAATSKQKAGFFNTQGWLAYVLGEETLVKRFPFVAGALHPDMGCNTEVFTDSEMLEIETLGPLSRLAPGTSVEHEETWELLHRSSFERGSDIDDLTAA